MILVGAASKGIIQRNFQHNATVYKTPYAKNPFDAVTDEEIEYYKNSVERGTLGSYFKKKKMCLSQNCHIFHLKFVPLLINCFMFLDKDQIKDQLDSDHFSPSRQTETFIISESEDPSKAGLCFEFYFDPLKLFYFMNYRISLFYYNK